jgi:hypothetical protein
LAYAIARGTVPSGGGLYACGSTSASGGNMSAFRV